jgi:hypothetical protein
VKVAKPVFALSSSILKKMQVDEIPLLVQQVQLIRGALSEVESSSLQTSKVPVVMQAAVMAVMLRNPLLT